MKDRLEHYKIPTDLPIVSQISRFDRWKDPEGVIENYDGKTIPSPSYLSDSPTDLNRNFPASNWQADSVTHKWDFDSPSCVQLSPGSSPLSEPEATALARVVDDLQPECVVSIHSPLGLIDDPESTELGETLAERTGMKRTVLPNEHTPGSFGSWTRDRGVPTITYELPNLSVWDMLPVHLPLLRSLLEKGLSMGR